MRRAAAVVLVGALSAGCGVGDERTPDTDDRDEELGILCNAELDLSGTFAAGEPARPAEVPTGCWPVGTWTFSASLRSNECSEPPVQLETTYSFRVDRSVNPDPTQDLGWEESYTYLGDRSKLYRLKVSEGGGAECEGGLELYNDDGTEFWNLKPALGGTTIMGFAEYAKYDSDQRSPDPTEL
jgi:hypothetical protein